MKKTRIQKKGRRAIKLSHRIAAAVTVGVIAGLSDPSFAGPSNANFATMSTNIVTASNEFTRLINFVAYVAGTGMGVTGVLKLKQHVDAPYTAPMKDALARLGCGGALLALPWLLNSMMGAIADNMGAMTNAAPVQLTSFTAAGGSSGQAAASAYASCMAMGYGEATCSTYQ